MKRFKIAGVTLLEVMLVLAIAAMIIIMSVRYYQATNESEQTTALMQQIQAVNAAADQLSEGTGNYTNVSTNSVSALVPNGINTAWGGKIGVAAASSGNGITVTIPNLPENICNAIAAEIKNLGSNYSGPPSCSNGTVTYTYSSIQVAPSP